MSEPDDAMTAVRRIREEISRECGNDPHRLVEYYMSLQERHKDRLIETGNQADDAAADAPPRC